MVFLTKKKLNVIIKKVFIMKYLDKGISLINKIKSYGYDAYLIGGCVRDFLLNIQSNDIDVATSMPLDLLKKEFISTKYFH